MKQTNSARPPRRDRGHPSKNQPFDMEEVGSTPISEESSEYVKGWPPLKRVVNRSRRRLLPPRR